MLKRIKLLIALGNPDLAERLKNLNAESPRGSDAWKAFNERWLQLRDDLEWSRMPLKVYEGIKGDLRKCEEVFTAWTEEMDIISGQEADLGKKQGISSGQFHATSDHAIDREKIARLRLELMQFEDFLSRKKKREAVNSYHARI